MPRKRGQPWPEKRKEHAATFITDDNGYMLMSGGYNEVNGVHFFYDDMWILEIASMTWKKVKIQFYNICGMIIFLIFCLGVPAIWRP